MTTEDRIDEFLKAESEANRLIDELIALKRETESYKAAADHLEGARTDITHLTDRLGEIALGIRASVDRLNEIGMPQILESQDAMTKSLKGIEASNRSINDAVNRLLIEQLPKILQAEVATKAAVDGAAKELAGHISAIKSLLAPSLAVLGFLVVIAIIVQFVV